MYVQSPWFRFLFSTYGSIDVYLLLWEHTMRHKRTICNRMHTAWARPLRWGHSSDAEKMAKSVCNASTWMVSFHRILKLFFFSFFVFRFSKWTKTPNPNNHKQLHWNEMKNWCDICENLNSIFWMAFSRPRRTRNRYGRRTHNVIFDLFDRNPININCL